MWASSKATTRRKDIQLATVFTLSSNALVQQLAAGSLDAALSTGIVDPVYAIDKGAPIAILRLEMVSPPYALLAKPGIASIKELKGKTIMVDGPKGITRLYVERMLAANGIKPGENRDPVRGRDLGALLGAGGGRDRRHHPAAAVQLLRRVGRVPQPRPVGRLYAGAAVHRRGGQPRLGGGAPGHARPVARGPQSEHGVVPGYSGTGSRPSP